MTVPGHSPGRVSGAAMARGESGLEGDTVGGGRSLVEMVAVLQGRCAEPSSEGSIHGFDGAEAAGARYLVDGDVSAFDESACRFEADGFDVFGGADSDLSLEQSAEVPFGQVGQ